jgi:asparagine synthase (glutamine-hydrolysing)
MAATVARMTASLAHRGPDADGLWEDPQGRCALGHRRLSIIDTSDAGRQPMATGDGRWLVTFNGEIYNFQEVRPALEAAGVRLRGRTDTEILIEAIALWGTDALSRFDGMFAFAAFDTQSGEMILARDPFGEKPLYYLEQNGALAFASELQAIELVPNFDATVDVNAIAEVLAFQYIGAPRSIYRSVRKLPPGHWLRIDAAGRIQTGRYFQFRPGQSGFSSRPMSDLVDELEDILVRSVRRRLISDVPLGAFLSGGVDSSTVCALIRRKLDRPIMTFSTGFAGAPESEHMTARAFAEHLGTDHHEEMLEPDAAEFLFNIGRILDEPNADSSCLPVYLLSRFARRHVTVAVSGDGGDEMFGGYGRYFATLDELARHRAGRLPGWTPGAVYFGNRILVSDERHISELLDFVPVGFSDHLGRVRDEIDEGADRLLCEMRRSDVDNYMPGAVLAKVDRMSMQHALEVRTPFLNVELARFAERLPDDILVQRGHGKKILRELAYRFLPRKLIDLPKQGFGLPMSDWARNSLLDIAGKMIESDESRVKAAFGAAQISRFMARQRTSGQFAAYQVWAIAMLESWLRHHPAKFSSLNEARLAWKRADAARKASRPGLHAIPIGDGVFAVQRNALANVPGGECRVAVEVPFKAIGFVNKSGTAPAEKDRVVTVGKSNVLTLADWGEPVAASDMGTLGALRGACLVFLDADAALKFDYAEFHKFIALGVRSVVLRDVHTGEWKEFRLQQLSFWQRVGAAANLFIRRVALLSEGAATWPLPGSYALAKVDGGGLRSGVIDCLDGRAEQDLSASYMVYEGLRQLPPLHSSPRDVGAKGNGRYSVIDRRIVLSPTATGRSTKRPYWVVKRSPDVDPYLEIAPVGYSLYAIQVGDGVYVVKRDKATAGWSSENVARATPTFRVPFGAIGIGINENVATALDDKIVELADWGEPVSAARKAELGVLRGANLIFIDSDAGQRFDFAEFRKFIRLGAQSVVFHNVYTDEWTEFRLQQLNVLQRVRAAMRLFPRRVALFSGPRSMFRLLRTNVVGQAPDGCWQSGTIEAIHATLDRELSGTYMAFEGMRQMPPVHVSHRDISAKGNGRYSVFNRTIWFSPTEGRRWPKRPIWIVKRGPDVDPLLEILPTRSGDQALDDQAIRGRFARLIDQVPTQPFALEPGDPVVVFTHNLSPGGAERQWVYLAQALAAAGYRVTFVTYQPLDEAGSHYVPLLERSGIPIERVSPLSRGSPLSAFEHFCWWIGREDAVALIRSGVVPDIELLVDVTAVFDRVAPKAVFAQLDHPNLIAGYATHMAGVPRIVMSFRNYNPTNFPYLHNDWYLPAYRLLSTSPRVYFSGNNRDANADYAKWIGMPPERVAHIPNAIDAEAFPIPTEAELAAKRAELGIEPGTPVVIGVHRFSAEKGPLEFIDVCAGVVKAMPRVRILVVGTGPLQSKVEERIAEHGLQDNVTLLGRRSDVNVLMSVASVFLLTSVLEGMPNVVLEAQLMEVPIVATRTGGTLDTVIEGDTAVLRPIGDIEGLAAACCELLRDPARLRRMGQAGRWHVISSYGKEQLGQRYVDLVRGT